MIEFVFVVAMCASTNPAALDCAIVYEEFVQAESKEACMLQNDSLLKGFRMFKLLPYLYVNCLEQGEES